MAYDVKYIDSIHYYIALEKVMVCQVAVVVSRLSKNDDIRFSYPSGMKNFFNVIAGHDVGISMVLL